MPGLQIGPRLSAFLSEVHPATLGTRRRDNSVQMNPLWYEFRDGLVWLNGGPQRGWVHHLERDGQATLLFLDPANMFRWAQVQARLVDTTEEGAGEHINHLSHRYNDGRDYPGPTDDRLIVRLEPTRVTGGENRQPWDVTNA